MRISERDNVSDNDNRQPSPKTRLSSSLLRNSSPTHHVSKIIDKVSFFFQKREIFKNIELRKKNSSLEFITGLKISSPAPHWAILMKYFYCSCKFRDITFKTFHALSYLGKILIQQVEILYLVR